GERSREPTGMETYERYQREQAARDEARRQREAKFTEDFTQLGGMMIEQRRRNAEKEREWRRKAERYWTRRCAEQQPTVIADPTFYVGPGTLMTDDSRYCAFGKLDSIDSKSSLDWYVFDVTAKGRYRFKLFDML